MLKAATIFAMLIFGCFLTICSFRTDGQKVPTNETQTPASTSLTGRKYLIADKTTPVVKRSNIIELIRAKRTESKDITGKQLAVFANDLIKRIGYDFTFSWEPKGKVNEANLLKAGEDYYPFYLSLFDATGKKHKFQFMNNNFGAPCFSVIDIPVTKVGERNLNIVSEGSEIGLVRPKVFDSEEVVLVEESLKKQIRKWSTPIDSTPVGISEDGTKIYFDTWEFHQNQYAEYAEDPIQLAVEVSVDGTLRFVDFSEIPSDKGIDIDNDKKYTEITYRRYRVGNKKHIVKFSYPCT
jgi:hypothetical protein